MDMRHCWIFCINYWLAYQAVIYAADTCQNGYALLSLGCYLNSGVRKNLTDATPYCNSKNGHVLTIDNQAEHDMLIAYYMGLTSGRPNEVLMNIKKVSHPHSWVYVSDNTPVTFMSWWGGEPSMAEETCCALLLRDSGQNWIDVSCTQRDITCERSKEASLTTVQTSCKMCGMADNNYSAGITTLLDGDTSTCHTITKDARKPRFFSFGTTKIEAYKPITVEILASKCESPYLSLVRGEGCVGQTSFECTFISETLMSDGSGLKKCAFKCHCQTCACILAQAFALNGVEQKICEVKIIS